MSPDFIASVLGKIALALPQTFAFIVIASFLEVALNDGTDESRFHYLFGLTAIIFGAVYLWQNR
jgi:hypothetical protein